MAAPELSTRNSGFSGRGYKHPFTGQVVPSVTTVLKMAASPGIVQWAVDQTAAYATANIDGLLSRSEQQGYNMLRWYHKRNPLPLEQGYDVRNYHLGVLNDSAELGTSMHDWIEADIDSSRIIPDTTLETDLFWQMVPVWNEWLSRNFVDSILTEVTVWNADEGYAGTFDLFVRINGQLWLIDIKTARSLWPDHSMQMAALKEAPTVLIKQDDDTWEELDWQEMQGADIKYGFLHIRPDDVDNQGNAIPAYCELIEAQDLDLHYEWFKGLLAAKKCEIEIATRQKERAKSQVTSSSETQTIE